ncbi:D-alanine--poly(phosphoribitol) ligase subunit DltA [Mammaliicoccus sp. Dog046]|uniref:D-alanine--poly(phosphoribitol) ligase subunit DltA n=1 Tax=Mammaliicoccus sp. Dog046 TaxID=3034233 RepID=UPI002B2605EE|nr:D-alanine--poly(phosphoribitol) ligase subunit DltA [Mammaliicoccus sp. Dog046]WQK84895.1 D-alanine--poly(phosphoribitol) ligase subunit DltA [Mammaliicoccus sp. Dog046]
MRDILEQLSYMSEYHTDNVAISYRETSLTYGELDFYSNQLATLIGHSKQPLVLYGHMSPFMIVGMIASMKAGNGYVPIDISLPIERIEHIIEKVEPVFIFNTTGKILNELHIEQITIEDCVQTEIRLEDIEPIKREQTVYTIFTSGSTGLPKGVQISYESLLDFIQWMTDLNKVGNHKKWLNQAPFSFDLSVMSIYPCLMTGGTLELVDKQMIEKPRELYDLLNHSEVESWVSTPSFLEMCLLLPDFNQDKYPKLKQFFFCGEIFSHKTAQKLLDLYRDATIYNTYGPTEATVAITGVQITQDILDQFNPLPVGTVRPNTEIELTDRGELVIIGKSVSQGYLKDKEKHNKVFKNINGKVHYHTGDKATFRDGYWFIQGRLDFQIKINGYRMELEEIEMILEQLPEVKQAMITPIKNGEKVQYLYATLVLTEMSTINEAEMSKQVKAALKLQLPEYMIPRKFRFVDQLPLTVNGKLDRKKVLEEIQS